MSDFTKWFGGGVIGAVVVGYLAVGAATAFVFGLIGETSDEPVAWWANPAVCVFAWPLVWYAAMSFVAANS